MAASRSLGETLSVAASISRLHIVAIASAGTLTFGWVLTGKWYLLVAAVSALDWFLVNLLNRVVDFEEDRANRIVGTDFVGRHRRSVVYGSFGLLVLSLVLVAYWAPWLTPLRVAYHALGLSYNWPILPGKRRIKELYFWKNTASAVGFMLTVFGYPLAFAWSAGQALRADLDWPGVLVIGTFFFAFELSFEVIYDLRDAEGDALAGVRSYPVVHGQRGAVRIIDGLIIGSSVLLLAGYLGGLVPWRAVVMIVAPVFQMFFYKKVLKRGINSRDCVLLTWVGAAMLGTYDLWVVLGLPGA